MAVRGLSAIRSSAELDPLGPGGVTNHSDGWGFTVVNYGGDNALRLHYRSLTPIYRDGGYESFKAILSSMLKAGESYGIFHVLNAADKRLIRIYNVHPSVVYVNGGELHVVHNGVVNKYALHGVLTKAYGLRLNVEDLSDTYVLAHLIASIFNEVGDLEKAVVRLADVVRGVNGLESALNTAILLIKQCCAELIVTTMYADEVLNNEKRRKYFNIFVGKLDNGVFAASSTLVKAYGLAQQGDVVELEPGRGELIYCRLSPSGFRCGAA